MSIRFKKLTKEKVLILPQVWPAFWLIAEDLMWGPEWDMWEYFGYRPDVDPPNDNMGAHLCFGQWPKQKWRFHWLNQFDNENDIQSWHTYGFEWTADKARWVNSCDMHFPDLNISY